MVSPHENIDFQLLDNLQIDQDSSVAKRGKHIEMAIKWRIGSAIGLIYQVTFAIMFGYAVYNNTCTNTEMTSFSQGIAWLSLVLVPFLLIMFGAAIYVKKEKVYHWKKFFYATTMIVTGWNLFLLIGSSVILSKGTSEDGCGFLYSLYKYFIIMTSIMLAMASVIIFYFVFHSIKSCFGERKKDKSNY